MARRSRYLYLGMSDFSLVQLKRAKSITREQKCPLIYYIYQIPHYFNQFAIISAVIGGSELIVALAAFVCSNSRGTDKAPFPSTTLY